MQTIDFRVAFDGGSVHAIIGVTIQAVAVDQAYPGRALAWEAALYRCLNLAVGHGLMNVTEPGDFSRTPMIQTIHAFVVVDAEGVEGVLRRVTPAGTQPMIADTADRLEHFRPDAEQVAREMGLPLRVAMFERKR